MGRDRIRRTAPSRLTPPSTRRERGRRVAGSPTDGRECPLGGRRDISSTSAVAHRRRQAAQPAVWTRTPASKSGRRSAPCAPRPPGRGRGSFAAAGPVNSSRKSEPAPVASPGTPADRNTSPSRLRAEPAERLQAVERRRRHGAHRLEPRAVMLTRVRAEGAAGGDPRPTRPRVEHLHHLARGRRWPPPGSRRR